MVLQSDVKDRSGRTLLRSGMQLTEKNLHVLKTWGVVEVFVNTETEYKNSGGNAEISIERVDPKVLAQTKQKLADHFSYADVHNSVMQELFDICLIRKLKSKLN